MSKFRVVYKYLNFATTRVLNLNVNETNVIDNINLWVDRLWPLIHNEF